MTATFLAYGVASRAMEASQASINIVGNNISNVNTEGYTRQRVDIVSVTTSGKTEKYATPVVSTGIGSKAVGTTQLRDPYIDARYRTQNAETNRYQTMVKGLSNLEDIFDEASAEALQGELSSFINDLQKLGQMPTSTDIAQVARSAAEKVTQTINMYATQLEEVRTEQTENLEVTVKSEFNTYVKNIAALNEQIQKEEIYGNTPNELYDHRNLLIDKLSGLANIKVSTSPTDRITENLSIAHYRITIDNPAGGEAISIIDNDKYAEMSMDVDATTDPPNVQLAIVDTKGEKQTDVNKMINDGSLKGYLDILNGKGSFADILLKENEAKGIHYYNEKMNIFARKFASELNKINGNVSKADHSIGTDNEFPLFSNGKIDDPATPLINESLENITAQNIQVSREWLENPAYINTTKYKYEVTVPPALPGQEHKATPASPDNIERMVAKMSDKLKYFDSSGNLILEGTFNEYMTSTLSEVATEVELNNNFSKTATNVFQTISDARDAVAGVSLNEEGVNLSAYQKVYNAAMRYFNVLDENLDNIINKMGV